MVGIRRRREAPSGFTLVELMIVVAIIGVLATIAIPNFQTYILRVKRSETPAHVAQMKLAEHAYMAEWDVYTACPLTPPVMPGREPAQFGVQWDDEHAFAYLGWVFDGDTTYAQYQVETDALGEQFVARGQTDIDGDSVYAVYEAEEDLTVHLVTANNVY